MLLLLLLKAKLHSQTNPEGYFNKKILRVADEILFVT